MSDRSYLWTLGLVGLAALAACEAGGTGDEAPAAGGEEAADTAAPSTAAAPGQETSGRSVRVALLGSGGDSLGTATLRDAGVGVEVSVQASGLPPGPKGFHIHGTGRCDPPDFQSAGGHFNPTNRQHGIENPEGPHAGDLPNLTVGDDGRADTTFVAPGVTLQPGREGSLMEGGGTALVIHAGRDDQRTDPSGDSGNRVACGVIREG